MFVLVLFNLAIIAQANRLLPHVRMKGHPGYTVDRIEDIPWLFVLVFELLTADPIPDQLKPFVTFLNRAQTIQRIIDTLQKVRQCLCYVLLNYHSRFVEDYQTLYISA